MATVRKVMSETLFTVSPSTTVGEAVALMAQHRVGSMLVMDDAGSHDDRPRRAGRGRAEDDARPRIPAPAGRQGRRGDRDRVHTRPRRLAFFTSLSPQGEGDLR